MACTVAALTQAAATHNNNHTNCITHHFWLFLLCSFMIISLFYFYCFATILVLFWIKSTELRMCICARVCNGIFNAVAKQYNIHIVFSTWQQYFCYNERKVVDFSVQKFQSVGIFGALLDFHRDIDFTSCSLFLFNIAFIIFQCWDLFLSYMLCK